MEPAPPLELPLLELPPEAAEPELLPLLSPLGPALLKAPSPELPPLPGIEEEPPVPLERGS